MASTKREYPAIDEQSPHTKRLKKASDESFSSNQYLRAVLNPADCDLAFNIEGDGLTGHALYEQGFAYCWSGARGNIGITGGKYCFGCKIVYCQPVEMEDTPPNQQNVSRVGISRGDDPVGNLGETKHSYGFGGTGKFSNAARFVDYGERFGIGDTIVCLVDLESKPWGSIEFSKNGKRLGIAMHFDAGPRGLGVVDSPPGKIPWESALFPHVLLKNTVVEMQFSMEDGLVPEEGYKPWASAMKDGKALIGPSFSDAMDCEVIMMVGLPASGKTTWAEKWVKEHPEKRYVLLGTNLALDQMKVPGLLRKSNYGERFDRLMDRATGIFNTLLSRASKIPRNYIIDQTNVYISARKRKLKPFATYHKIAVVVFPKQEELKVRAEKRFKEMGKEVPPEAVNKMLANFVLPMSKDMPGTDEDFGQVIFTELNRVEAQQQLDEMKRALALSSSAKSESIYSSFSRENSVNSDCRMSDYSLPGSRHSYTGYSRPSVGVQRGSSWVSHPEPGLEPYPTYVNRGYTGHGQPGRIETIEPFPPSINSRYQGPGRLGFIEPSSGSYQGSFDPMPGRDAYPGMYSSYNNLVPRDDLARYDGYTHDPHRRYNEAGYSHGTPTGRRSNLEDARSAYQVSYGSLYGTPYPKPYGSHPANLQQPGGATYRPPRYY